MRIQTIVPVSFTILKYTFMLMHYKYCICLRSIKLSMGWEFIWLVWFPPQTAEGFGTLRHRLVTTAQLVRIPTTEAFSTNSSRNWHPACSTKLQMLSSLYLLGSFWLFRNDALTEDVTLCWVGRMSVYTWDYFKFWVVWSHGGWLVTKSNLLSV
jgi:hypothetical protein